MLELTMPRKTWYAAYRESAAEAAAMAQDPAWRFTGFRQDHLSVARTFNAVLDAHPPQGPWDPEEQITADVPGCDVGLLMAIEFLPDDLFPVSELA